jgi:6-pyruvoyltetrahydropterin/6-carboxytetrahydropterin synthase
MEIFTTLSLEAAHRLPNVPDAHKCSRIHGHHYAVTVVVRGAAGADTGWVMDFADLREACRPVSDQLDHRYLNDVPGLENPTAENIARWIWDRLKPALPQLSRIVVNETPGTGCTYQGEDGP